MKKILKDGKRSNFLKLIKESDRGCVSVVCEFFNKMIAGILVMAMVAKVIPKKQIPSKFGLRIKDARRARLITDEQRKALECIADLRNSTDHSDLDFSLTDKGVVSHLKTLEKYAAMIIQEPDRLMDFEGVFEITSDENMPRFQFLVTTNQIYKELQKKVYELVEIL
jgi:hypothetical protein